MLDSQQLPAFLNEKEVAAYLRVSVATLRRRRLLNQPPRATKIGAAVRYNLKDVNDFIGGCPTIGGGKRGS